MNIRRVTNAPLDELNQFLTKLETLATGDNNVVSFRADAYETPAPGTASSQSLLQEIVLDSCSLAFRPIPNYKKQPAKISELKLTQVPIKIAVDKLEQCIPKIDGMYQWAWAEKSEVERASIKPAFDYSGVASEFWSHVGKCIDYRTAYVWEVKFPDRWQSIIWDFHFAIQSSDQQMWLILAGGGDD